MYEGDTQRGDDEDWVETSRLQSSLDTDINFTAQYSLDLFYLASLKINLLLGERNNHCIVQNSKEFKL